MRIVMLTDLYDERLHYQDNLLARYYVKHGHAVTVIASTFDNAFDYYANRYDPKSKARTYTDAGVRVVKLPYSLNVLNRLRRFGGVRQILVNECPDMIFSHDIHLNLSDAAWYRQRNPGCRIIMDCHSDYSNSAKNWMSLNVLHKVIRRSYLNRYKQHISRFFPIVPASAVFLHEVYGIPHDEMELLPLGVDSDLADRVKRADGGAQVRRALGIPSAAFVIFTGGKFTAAKKTHLLVEACAALNDPSIHLLLVGDAGPAEATYRSLLESAARANPRIHFVGWVGGDDVYNYMHASDIAVFPASQSVLWQQAVGMGLPLVVGTGARTGEQDPSYMNLYDNIVALAYEDIRTDVIVRTIASVVADRVTLARRRIGAERTAAELLSYDRIVHQTLR